MPTLKGVPDGEDDWLEMLNGLDFEHNCVRCEYYKGDGTCGAYPKGIPEVLLTGEVPHTEPFEGDRGIRFTPKAKTRKEKLEARAKAFFAPRAVPQAETGGIPVLTAWG